jgi:tellurite resistance protein
MSVTPETEWLLVACGLIAHADGVLDGNEVERLMAMVDDRIPEDDYGEWLDLIGNKAALEARYAGLADPPAAQHRGILEEAWAMAMVDGERNAPELVVLARIAERFGVEPMQLEFWRAAWTTAEQEFSNRVAELAVLSLGGGEAVFEDDHSAFLDLMERLPTSNDERQRLGKLGTEPPTPPLEVETLARALAGMPRIRRVQAFTLVASLVRFSVDRDNAAGRFENIGRAAGLLDVGDLL